MCHAHDTQRERAVRAHLSVTSQHIYAYTRIYMFIYNDYSDIKPLYLTNESTRHITDYMCMSRLPSIYLYRWGVGW